MKQVEGSLPERVRCSSLVDWPVYPRLRGTMLTTTPKRNPASKSNRSDAVPRPSEGHVPAQRELQRRHPAAEVGTLLGLR